MNKVQHAVHSVRGHIVQALATAAMPAEPPTRLLAVRCCAAQQSPAVFGSWSCRGSPLCQPPVLAKHATSFELPSFEHQLPPPFPLADVTGLTCPKCAADVKC